MEYLHDKKYYEDLYDRHTIEECKMHEKHCKNKEEYVQNGKRTMKVTVNICEFLLYFVKGDRYKDREESIQSWMARDRKKQSMYDNTPEPRNNYCDVCKTPMRLLDKSLRSHGKKSEFTRVLFCYVCEPCRKIKSLYENGEEQEKVKPSPCPECGSKVKFSIEEREDGDYYIDECEKCDYKDEFKSCIEKPTPESEEEFLRDKEKYCLSLEEGHRYISFLHSLDGLKGVMDEMDHKGKNKELFEKFEKVKGTTIARLNRLISQKLKKHRFEKLKFGQPHDAPCLSIPFHIQDVNPDRGEYDSKKLLKKTLEEILKETNWILMSDGISYRMGLLKGNLRAVEDASELKKLIAKRFKIDYKEPKLKDSYKFEGIE